MITPQILFTLLAEAAPAAPVIGSETGVAVNVGIAVGLLIASLVLLMVEFVVISGGMLGIGSVVCAGASIYYAFAAGDLAGWVFAVLVPLLGILGLRTGLAWMRKSRLVTHAEITADAGYHHAFAGKGIGPGSEGVLVTDAYPTGRARFQGASGPVEIDVTLRGAGVEAGARVTIKAVEGPVVIASRLDTPAPAQP